MKIGTIEKLKFKNLQRRLHLPLWQAVGLLETLWWFARRYAPFGDVGKFTNEEIAACMEYAGDCDHLVESLIQSGWLECVPDERRLICVDWVKALGRYRRWIPDTVRAFVMARDDGLCRYCGSPASSLDHVMPYSRGGDESPANLVAACIKCNSRKNDRTPVEAGMELIGGSP